MASPRIQQEIPKRISEETIIAISGFSLLFGLALFGSYFRYWFAPQVNHAERKFLRNFTRKELMLLVVGSLFLGLVETFEYNISNVFLPFILLLCLSFWYNGSHLTLSISSNTPENPGEIRYGNVNKIIMKAYIVSLLSLMAVLAGSYGLISVLIVIPNRPWYYISFDQGYFYYMINVKEIRNYAPIFYALLVEVGLTFCFAGICRFATFCIVSLSQPYITAIKFLFDDWTDSE